MREDGGLGLKGGDECWDCGRPCMLWARVGRDWLYNARSWFSKEVVFWIPGVWDTVVLLVL